MMNLTSADLVRIVTSVAADVDVFASYVDKNGTTITPGNQATAITTATTTTVVSAPAASTQRNINTLYICNRDTTDGTMITVEFYDGTATQVIKKGIGPGGVLMLDDMGRWTVLPSGVVTKQFLTATGAGLYTKPPGVTSIFIECLGAGGGSGACTTAATNSAAGGGGAAGEYVCGLLNNPADTYPYFIGSGTTAIGGPTIFGDDLSVNVPTDRILIAMGGNTGGSDTVAVIHVGGLGGVGSTEVMAAQSYRRQANPGGTGLAIAAAQALSGQGGSPWMYGAGGNSRKTTGAGNAGLGKGAGGGGACILSGGANQTAGAGSSGMIIVTEFR